jgi:hypothetical protein
VTTAKIRRKQESNRGATIDRRSKTACRHGRLTPGASGSKAAEAADRFRISSRNIDYICCNTLVGCLLLADKESQSVLIKSPEEKSQQFILLGVGIIKLNPREGAWDDRSARIG